jgi:hypothetical protein
MDYDDRFHPAMDEDVFDDETIHAVEKMDRGLNLINLPRNRKKLIKPKRVKVYTSSHTGLIRDAETGEYYNNKVGSKDEDLFFKVTIATGECTSANHSTNAFYTSPYHYFKHMRPKDSSVDSTMIANWEAKRDRRLHELEANKKDKCVYVN